MKHLLPEGWPKPKGYSNGISVENGKTLYVAGLIGWNKDGKFESDTLVGQLRTTLKNTLAVLPEGGAGPEHVVRMTWYVTDKQEYKNNLKEIGKIYTLNNNSIFNIYNTTNSLCHNPRYF